MNFKDEAARIFEEQFKVHNSINYLALQIELIHEKGELSGMKKANKLVQESFKKGENSP